MQQFHANDRIAYPFYEVLAEARLPVIIHTGHSGIGTGMRGGGGVRLKYGNPMDVDDVAVDFPDMPIILAHPSFPWQDEAISVCLHKPQVYIDLSGWSPKYFSPILIQYANTLLKRKMLFGSDYPLITPDRWLADFANIAIRDEVRPLILRENAIRLLGLDAAGLAALGMNLFFPLQHSNEVLNLPGASLGFFHRLNSPQNRIPVGPVHGFEKCGSSRIRIQCFLEVGGHGCPAR